MTKAGDQGEHGCPKVVVRAFGAYPVREINADDRPKYLSPQETRLWYRVAFVEHYIDDADFRTALEALADHWQATIPDALWQPEIWSAICRPLLEPDSNATHQQRAWAQSVLEWVERVRSFCREWGLTFADEAGEAAVHSWARWRRRRNELKPEFIRSFFHAGISLPDPEITPPPTMYWHPTDESREGARERILKAWAVHLDAELDRIEAMAAHLPRRPRKRSTYAQRDLYWLFRRQRYGESYGTIARNHTNFVEPATVRMACIRMSKKIGLILH